MSKYGLPYLGSKAKICDELIYIFPKATHFYDVFGGGFAVTHAMLLKRPNDYKSFHFNEIRPGITTLIQDAIEGKYNYDRFKPEWISRERFHAEKETNPYIKLIWSFGNNGEDYIFGKQIENAKRSLHNAIIFNEFDDYAREILGLDKFRDGYSVYDKRIHLRNRVCVLSETSKNLQQLQRLEQLEQLQRLERLQQLQQLQQLERLERLQQLQQLSLTQLDYRDVKIEPDAVVYCDPPYAGTADYGRGFDTSKFLDWAAAIREPVYISEYSVNDSRFRAVASIEKMQRLSSASRKVKQEMVYANKPGYEKWFYERVKRA